MDRQELKNIFLSTMKMMGDKDEDSSQPLQLYNTLEFSARVRNIPFDESILKYFSNEIFSEDLNSNFRNIFGGYIRYWDLHKKAKWIADTEPNTQERRNLILKNLNLSMEDEAFVIKNFPRDYKQPTVISAEHTPWYPNENAISFYWDAYRKYLQTESKWPQNSINDLDHFSTSILEHLTNPESPQLYPSRGLVVGYVQSGKTANFTAVIAKAVDAGYRLIIVLAGTLDLLREQTQRRIDKELIGKEIIEASAHPSEAREYDGSNDWDSFISHGSLPSELGYFDWVRFTGEGEEFKGFSKGGHYALMPMSPIPGRRLNDPECLKRIDVKILVVKKHAAVLRKLNKAITTLKTDFTPMPTLIIDDESDQAGINTAKPSTESEKKRTATNKQIVSLLKNLPSAQYIGYTATPFANVLVDPNDDEDLFPKDFIISLPRPDGYMGVSDFYDFDPQDWSYLDEDKVPPGYFSNRKAFVREIRGKDDKLENLPKAIDTFILSGAIKLYRCCNGCPLNSRHHTMLIHCDTQQTEHTAMAKTANKIFNTALKRKIDTERRLKNLWDEDFMPVSTVKKDLGSPMPNSFEELIPFIKISLDRMVELKPVRIVNGMAENKDDHPNFDKDEIWSILVGGYKLSRGYTLEGLTISYFTRNIRTADTLMQAGRWFGFRRNYKDLVRLFLGKEVAAGKKRVIDLYEEFGAICRDEETFRLEVERYVLKDGVAITPLQVPPLISSHSDYLKPVAKNKMHYAYIEFKNFGGATSESGKISYAEQDRKYNAELVQSLLCPCSISKKNLGVIDDKSKAQMFEAYVNEVTPEIIIKFLEGYRWQDKKPVMQRQIEFLKGGALKKIKDPEIDRWVIIFPQKSVNSGPFWNSSFSVFERHDTGTRFNVFSTGINRNCAQYIAGSGTTHVVDATEDTKTLTQVKTAVALLYPVVRNGELGKYKKTVPDGKITLGFCLIFPPNKIKAPVFFGTSKK